MVHIKCSLECISLSVAFHGMCVLLHTGIRTKFEPSVLTATAITIILQRTCPPILYNWVARVMAEQPVQRFYGPEKPIDWSEPA